MESVNTRQFLKTESDTGPYREVTGLVSDRTCKPLRHFLVGARIAPVKVERGKFHKPGSYEVFHSQDLHEFNPFRPAM